MRLRSLRGALLLVLVIAAGGWLAAIASGLSGARQQLKFDLRAVLGKDDRTRTVALPGRPRAEPTPTGEASPGEAARVHEFAAAISTDAVGSPRDAAAQEPDIAAPFDDADPDVRDAIAAFVAGLDSR